MKSSLVSVIITTYKGSNSIERAVKSAINQTYSNIEIIVVDDNGAGSVDQKKTEAILQKYINDNTIKYIVHPTNKNGSAARNTGFKNSNGSYISFLDDDDVLLKEKVFEQVKVLDSLDESYGLVFCSGYILNEKMNGYKLRIVKSEENYLFDFLVGKLRFNTSMIMIRASVCEAMGGFDESFKRHQDWEFCTRIMGSYKTERCPKHLVCKITTARNNPETPEKAEELRFYFLGKMKPIIDTLEKKERKKIYDYHNSDIAIRYFKAKKYHKAFELLSKSGFPIFRLIKYYLKKMTARLFRRKVKIDISETQVSRG